jgi:hypothetical protein
MGKKSEEMIPAPAGAGKNIRNAVEGETVNPSEKYQICPSFLRVVRARVRPIGH